MRRGARSSFWRTHDTKAGNRATIQAWQQTVWLRSRDVFVNDAFGTAHRAHASNVGVAERLPSAAGRLLEAEISAFDRLLVGGDRPYVVVMGGAKISDKLAVRSSNLLPKVDLMLIGGGMCFTPLKASGYSVGNSLVEESMIGTVADLLASEHGDKIVLVRVTLSLHPNSLRMQQVVLDS